MGSLYLSCFGLLLSQINYNMLQFQTKLKGLTRGYLHLRAVKSMEFTTEECSKYVNIFMSSCHFSLSKSSVTETGTTLRGFRCLLAQTLRHYFILYDSAVRS